MNVSLNQLRRFVDLNEPAEEIEKILVKLGLEVESVEHRGMGKNDGIVVARIVHFEPHPHADRLRLCRVDMGDGELRQIVCGATNFRENDCVPLALPGAVLPGNVKIKKAKLRGIESEGMLCSGRELGLNSDQNGLLILKEGYPLGMKIHDVFPESDTIFSLEFTANRGDVLSHYGVARELAAWYNIPLAPIKVPQMAQFDGVTGDALAVEILSKDCELYTAIVLKNIRIGESVDWIRRDLEAVGVAVVNNIVDLTNWIMVTYGQPLHAFDRSKVGRKIMVRGASSGEKIRALDGKEYELNPSMLLICDENHPLGIAGVMGGEETKITENTTEIILESAYFVADSVRRTSRSLGINSDSAYRYARHVDPAQTENFQKIAVQMLVDLYGAKPASPIILAPRDAHFPSREIELDPNFVRKIFGFPVEDGVIFDLLVRLQYTVHRRDNGPWIVESPTYRWDVLRPIDLVEECLRIYGVDKIPSPITAMKIFPNASCNSVHKKREIIQFLAHNRFVECYNYSMVRETENALPIANPLIENQTHLRTSLIPGLVDVLRHNLQNGNKYAKFFEFGHVFRKLDDAFEELISVAFLLGTDSGDEHWEPFVKPTFFTVKNLMCHLWSIA
ncbi:MAG: phenylalanine--tRNA ligase subunit beta, partial [Puniceicoccales bacterium]|nr:phenylalanine--tRNA ligase subunit beta [Puniceicoccales bacterium]